MKLTKNTLKQLIMEEIGGRSNLQASNRSLAYAMPSSGRLQNYPRGEPPNNHNYEPYSGRDPYETGDIESNIKAGETLEVNGNVQYKLLFEDEDLTSGVIVPVGEYRFNIDKHTGQISWTSDVPAHVLNNSDLHKQIKDYSGREDQ